jgi:hypothetical protein
MVKGHVFVFGLMLFLASCSPRQPVTSKSTTDKEFFQGRILTKEYIPAHTIGMMPMTMVVPAQYSVTVEGENQDRVKKAESCFVEQPEFEGLKPDDAFACGKPGQRSCSCDELRPEQPSVK